MSNLSEELSRGRPAGATALTLGVFDGVHRGHQHLLERLQDAASQRGLIPAVVTFSNHPRSVLRPEEPLVWLTSLEDRLSLLRATGVGQVVPITFTKELSLLSAEEFLEELWGGLRITHFVVGPDFAMGHDRGGTIPVLRELAVSHRFSMEVVEPFTLEGAPVNSTAIRQALAGGEVERVADYLGRPFHLAGSVERGEGRGGAELGYATVNLRLDPSQAVPAHGVYAGWLTADGHRYKAAVSIGTRPTLYTDGREVVEAFLLDFEGDLYGQQVRLEFVGWLRGQERFPTVQELTAQMRRDVEEVRLLLAAPPTAGGGPKAP